MGCKMVRFGDGDSSLFLAGPAFIWRPEIVWEVFLILWRVVKVLAGRRRSSILDLEIPPGPGVPLGSEWSWVVFEFMGGPGCSQRS